MLPICMHLWVNSNSEMLLLVHAYLFFSLQMIWMCDLQVVVVLQQVFALIQTVLSKWLNDSQVVEVSLWHAFPHAVRPLFSHKSLPIIVHVSVTSLVLSLRLCVPSLRSRWRLCSMTSLLWCLSWVRCLGRCIVQFPRPQPLTSRDRYILHTFVNAQTQAKKMLTASAVQMSW